jgi:hypothetical protein
VALKTIRPHGQHGVSTTERFRREIQRASGEIGLSSVLSYSPTDGGITKVKGPEEQRNRYALPDKTVPLFLRPPALLSPLIRRKTIVLDHPDLPFQRRGPAP